ncbi:metallophosphoesterase family protein [Lacticigenium naphthae]|uniref:metallophosphoesterase family protein n=1 Tax=Lacticigenium naphthae TaxID=515351 RepID=UPI00041A11AC|nr:DNA repair exonuclease [Lacticigenium naphthae]
MIHFFHVADLHLDSPFKGLRYLPENLWKEVRNSTFDAFHQIVSNAIIEKIDFMLLVGDIYDSEDRSIKAQAFLKKELERLNESAIPVYIVHGNHDFISDLNLTMDMPDNVYVFGIQPETVQLVTDKNEKVNLTGFSYNSRWIEENKTDGYPTKKNEDAWQIGLLHGYNEGNAAKHAKYAPFTIRDLKDKGYDYWALGHIHKRQQLSSHPPVYYSGNIQGRHKNEEGTKGFLSVKLADWGNEIVFQEASQIIWQTLDINCTELNSLNTIIQEILTQLKKMKMTEKNYFVRLKLNVKNISNDLYNKLVSDDFLDILQLNKIGRNFVWVYKCNVHLTGDFKELALKKMFPEEWEKAIESLLSEEEFNRITNDLFKNNAEFSFLQPRDEDYRKKIVNESIEELTHLIGTKGDSENES